MENTSALNWPAVATILAVVLSALFAWISYVARTNNERKRILNSTLFNLLEIWHRLKRLDNFNSKQLCLVYLEEIKKQLPNVEISITETEQLTRLIENNLQSHLLQLVSKGEDLLEDSFQQSVNKLAEVEPLLAHSLHSNKAIKAAISELDNFINSTMVSFVHDEKDKAQADEMLKGMKKYMYSDAILDLESDLKILSFKIGIPTYIRTKKLLKSKSAASNGEMQRVLSKLISELIIPHIKISQTTQ